ncbi:uncharacterized protein A1O9_04236 [Exophiala aquamarina CBS 119918]|uniref:Cleavage/polyadenylation specificity factor A subunit C-terminal domain-containing protein n=1 Tax=Exophiala aquamarina CBS 119918 TaxID=1182545 RepID=A0A072PI24_9EURO|nr:uncharacterized protein A1O9_04236 [Exophiala aquamarina CBS 119918]KEF59392.1 hypothetical protein A1O9_04236 [Exophiala aquamarina CBS 119918]
MQCYTELIPPSGVTAALSLPFTSSGASNLVVARTSLLQIFRVEYVNNGQDAKLILIAEYNLAGTVTSLGRVKPQSSKSGGNAVLIALRDAKLSLIEWDPALHSIATTSIHYYEQDDLQAAPWQPELSDCFSRLTIDPSSRCAAFNFGVNHLAIIPLSHTSDDLAMEGDFDTAENGDATNGQSPTKTSGGPGGSHDVSNHPSFVLPTTALDPGLLHPVDIAFLYEYRDPTIGILYSTAARSSNMAPERKDVTIYAVYALDLEQKASTSLQSVQRLPNDLYRIIPLPLPVGGALLVGSNELIHIDQGGKSSAIALNEFARECSAFSMADHSESRVKLEGCQIERLSNVNGDMLIILQSGETAILSFRMDGRSLSGMSLRRTNEGSSAEFSLGAATCTAHLDQGYVFVGSEELDSMVLAAGKRPIQLKRMTSRAQLHANGTGMDQDDENDQSEDDDDDLYGGNLHGLDGGATGEAGASSTDHLRVTDRLPSIAPISDLAFGGLGKRKREDLLGLESYDRDEVELTIAYGRGRSGGVAFVSRRLEPNIVKRIKVNDMTGIWCFSSMATPPNEVWGERNALVDDLVIVSQTMDDGVGKSSLLLLIDGEFQPRGASEFDGSAGPTIGVGKLEGTNHTVQALPTEIRVYDADFGLSQIFPIVDEDEGQVAKVVRCSFAGPYVVALKDDGKVTLLKADKAGELDEVELPSHLSSKWIVSITLYEDYTDFFQTSRFYPDSSSRHLLSILTSEGHFNLLSLPKMTFEVFQCESLPYLPTFLVQDLQIPKHWRNQDEIAEILLADLGDQTERRPYLLVRNTTGDIILYEPFAVPDVTGSFKFKKVATETIANFEDQYNPEGESLLRPPMQAISNTLGYAWVFVPGSTSAVVLRHASTAPRVYELKSQGIRSICNVRSNEPTDRFILVGENDEVCFAEFPSNCVIGLSSWSIKRIPLGQDVASVSYFMPTDSYILGTNYTADFQLPQDDEWHPDWRNEGTNFLPTALQSSLKLFSPSTHSVISQYYFDVSERILCVKCLNLEISEETHERKDLIVVGTAIVKGENVTTRGNLYIFDVVDVVPEPDVPETDLKLKMIAKEDVRGAVSAISDVGSQGFVLAAQGQKCMVRGLKEDMSILPVAFLDMRYYVQVAKELHGTGLCILGDAFSGLWLVGYAEEPYKLQILGRDFENPEVIAAEFLPDGKSLYIISSDVDGQLRVLQYDPEDPKTERGSSLLLRSTFNIGASPTTMTLMPQKTVASARRSSNASADTTNDSQTNSQQQILITTQSGSLCMLTPVPEATYRRLSTLQNILLTTLDFQPCSLNPRAYRQVETDGIGGRGIIDGNLVRRWWEMSTQQRAASADKAGGSIWEVRGDLELIKGGDLAL